MAETRPSIEDAIDAYAQQCADEAPPLTPGQRDRIALLLRRRDPHA